MRVLEGSAGRLGLLFSVCLLFLLAAAATVVARRRVGIDRQRLDRTGFTCLIAQDPQRLDDFFMFACALIRPV